MFCIIVEHEELKQKKEQALIALRIPVLFCKIVFHLEYFEIFHYIFICNEDDAMFRFHGFADYKTHVCPQLARMATKRLHFILQVMITGDLNGSKPAKISKVLTPQIVALTEFSWL